MRLAYNGASSPSVRATSFACRLLNSTREFVNWEEKILFQVVIIWSNSKTSHQLAWKKLLVVFEATTKSTLWPLPSRLSYWTGRRGRQHRCLRMLKLRGSTLWDLLLVVRTSWSVCGLPIFYKMMCSINNISGQLTLILSKFKIQTNHSHPSKV